MLNGFTDVRFGIQVCARWGSIFMTRLKALSVLDFPGIISEQVGKFVQERRPQKIELIRVTLQAQECKVLQEQHYQQEPLSSPPFIDNSLPCL